MTATYTFDTFDIFASLDGCASHHGDWGGYWGKQGPELLEHRAELYGDEQRMVFVGRSTGAPRNWSTGRRGTAESGYGDMRMMDG